MRSPTNSSGRGNGSGERRIAGVWAAAFTAFVAIIAGLSAMTVWYDRNLTLENAQHHVGATARLMAAHAERAIEAGDKVLLSIVSDRNNQQPSAADGPRLHRQLQQLLARSPQLDVARLLDADGLPVAESAGPVPARMSYAERGFFRAHRAANIGLHLEAAAGDPAAEPQRFTLSRSIRGPDGGFRGVAVVRIYSAYFVELYREIDLAPRAHSSLHLLNGSLLASWPPQAERIDSAWLRGVTAEIDSGRRSGAALFEDGEVQGQVVGWKQLNELPVFVITAQPVGAVLADWRERARLGAGLALAAIAGFGVIALRGWRGAQAEAAAQRALRAAYDDLDHRIAERTRELAESEALAQRRLTELEALYADAPVGLALFDRDLRVLRINDVLATAIGLSPEQCLGRDFSEIMPDMTAALHANVRAVFDGGAAVSGFELRGRSPYRPDVERAWVEDYYPVKDQGGRVIAVGAIVRDITDRVRTEDALRESDRRMRLAQEAGGMGLWDWDLKTGIVVRSDSYYRVWGLPPERFEPNDNLRNLIHPEDRVRAASDMAAALAGERAYASEFRVPQPDGSLRWIELRGEVRYDENGTPERMIGVCFDITARKTGEERMRMLAAEVDHRSKNVLAIVQSMLQLTHAGSLEEYRAAAHGRIAALGRAHTLLSESRWEGADLRRLADEELAPFCSNGRRVEIAGPALLLPPGVAQALSVALHELATNAAKYGALSVPTGRVAVDWSVTDGWLRLTWQEIAGPAVSPPRRRGFGTRVIERIVATQLEGDVRFDWRPGGLLCAIAVPLRPDHENAGLTAA